MCTLRVSGMVDLPALFNYVCIQYDNTRNNHPKNNPTKIIFLKLRFDFLILLLQIFS